MFFLAHTYAATKVAGKNPLIVVGSTIPDIHMFGTTLDSIELHKKGQEFKNYLEQVDPSMVKLGIGMMLHDEIPTGLDFYAHKRFGKFKKGYVIKNCQLLIKKIKDVEKFGIPAYYEQFAHPFIEAAVDIIIAKKHPDIVKAFNDSIRKVNTTKIANYLSDFFEGSADSQDILEYYKLLRQTKYQSFDNFGSIYYMMSRRILNFIDSSVGGLVPDGLTISVSDGMEGAMNVVINHDDLGEIIMYAIHIVEPTYEHFLESSIKSMSNEMKKLKLL